MYKKEKISSELIEFYENCDLTHKICDLPLDYPPQNRFIPKNLDVLHVTENMPKYPQKILNDQFTELWYKQDKSFLLPNATIMIQFHLNKNFLHPYKYDVLSSLWKNVFQNELKNISYMATEAKLSQYIGFNYYGLYFRVYGFNSSLKAFVVEYFKMLRNLTSEDKLNKLKSQEEKLLKESNNFYYDSPYYQGTEYINYLLREPSSEPMEKINILEKGVPIEDLNMFVKNYLSNMRSTWLIQGNISKEEALEINQSVLEEMKNNRLREEDLPINRVVSIPASCNYYFILPSRNQEDINSCVVTYYQLGKLNDKEYCCALVLHNYLKEMFFDDLRTQQQLGYVATMWYKKITKIHGFMCYVQGSVKSPEYVRSRIHNFFNQAYTAVKNLSDELYMENVNSVIVEKKQKDLRLWDECRRNFREIRKRDFHFDNNETLVGILEKLEKSSVINFFEEHFIKNRRILDVEVLAQKHVEENLRVEVENQEMFSKENVKRIKVNSINDFKRRLTLFPDFYNSD
jgi:insulysin